MASSTASVSGLVSGLDTATIISQLMQVEANPQTLLKSRLSTEKSSISTLQSLNSSFAALATKAADLAKKTAWTPFTTTTTSPKVTATAGPTAGPGTLSFTVGSTASLHQLSFNQAALSTDVVTSGSTSVTLDTLDGNTVDIDTGDGTLDSLVSALNSANAGVSARTVKLDDGSFRLQVVSSTTGAASDFTLTNTDGTPILGGAAVIAGRDASITVGSDTVHSATNTFSGLVTGLDITLAADTAAGTAVDITSARDTTTAQSSVPLNDPRSVRTLWRIAVRSTVTSERCIASIVAVRPRSSGRPRRR